MGSERTSRGHTVLGASFSTPAWQVSAGSASIQPTKKPENTNYMTNVIDEPNQQGLAQTGASGPGPEVPSAVAITILFALMKVVL